MLEQFKKENRLKAKPSPTANQCPDLMYKLVIVKHMRYLSPKREIPFEQFLPPEEKESSSRNPRQNEPLPETFE
jgi:hypothetical protein